MKNLYLTISILLCAGVLQLSAQCDATFTYAPTSPTAMHFVANQVQQTGYTYYHTWDFGYGPAAYTPSIDYDFYGAGTYNVCHKIVIEDQQGNTICRDSTCEVITLSSSTCINNFYGYGYQTTGTTYVFTSGISDYTNIGVRWEFGDGTSETGIAAPIHSYPGYGVYNVCYYAYDTVQHCADSVCFSINIQMCPTPNFYYTQSNYSTTTTTFHLSGGGIQSVLWDFGDGTTSTLLAPTHTYSTFGVFHVCLTNTGGGCGTSYCQNVFVDSCSSTINHFIDYSYPGWTFLFQADTIYHHDINVGQNFYWDFGDGSRDSSYVFSAYHSYHAAGAYNVCLHTTPPGCNTLVYCDSVHITCDLFATFSSGEVGSFTMAYTPDIASYDTNIVYHWTFGDNAIGTEAYPVHVYPNANTWTTCLTIVDTVTGCTDSTCNTVVSSLWTDTICGYVFIDQNLNGIWDAGEYPVAGASIYLNTGANNNIPTTTDSSGYYMLTVPEGFITIGMNFNGNQQATLPFSTFPYGNAEYYYYFSTSYQRQCGFDFGIQNNYGSVSGMLYDDVNNNGSYAYPDLTIANQPVKINSQTVFSDGSGRYLAVVPSPQSYSVMPDTFGHFATYNFVPQQSQVTLSYPGESSINNDFGVQLSPTDVDLTIDLLPTTPIIPGLITSYGSVVTNLSPLKVKYNANVVTDNALSLNTTYTHSYFGNAGNVLTYHDSVWPLQQLYKLAYYNVSPNTFINQDLYSSANVTATTVADVNTANDTDLCHQIAVASFDPNDKESGQGRSTERFIADTTEIKYVINFQNTGTSDAINVIVKDVLDHNLDPKTIRLIGSLAFYDVRLLNDTLYFRFSNIDLPDSLNDPIYSRSWVAFGIKPKRGTAAGTQIHNSADIYFDLNPPVSTNTTLHTIDTASALSVTDIAEDGHLYIAPNPFAGQTTILLRDMPEAGYNYSVCDITGRVVMTGNITTGTPLILYRNKLSSGAYIISFSNSKGIVKRAKLIAE